MSLSKLIEESFKDTMSNKINDVGNYLDTKSLYFGNKSKDFTAPYWNKTKSYLSDKGVPGKSSLSKAARIGGLGAAGLSVAGSLFGVGDNLFHGEIGDTVGGIVDTPIDAVEDGAIGAGLGVAGVAGKGLYDNWKSKQKLKYRPKS